MKTLHKYLVGQVLASLLLTVAVFTFVLMLANALKEVLPLLVSGQVSPWIVLKALGLLIPFVWVFALPMGLLTATLLIFGRFSADQELTAVRASGVSLLSLASPILLLSLAFCALSALVNMEIGPRARVAYTDILDDLKLEFAKFQMPEGRFIKNFPGYIFYVGKNRKGDLEDVVVFELKDETNVVRTVRARHGRLEVDEAHKLVNLSLFEGNYISATEGGDFGPIGSFDSTTVPLDLNQARARSKEPRVDDMTFGQLRDELRKLEQMNFPISRQNATKPQLQAQKQEWLKRRGEWVSLVTFHMHRQVAFSFACFAFTLVGIPLGIRLHRRETNIGIAMALVLVAVYYTFIMVAQSVNTKPQFAPYLIAWLPNFVFQALGIVLLWRANRGEG